MRVHDVWRLTPERAALHEPTGTLVIADVHLGYGRSRQVRGDAIPEPRVADELRPLTPLVQRGARRLLVAGDLFEAGYEAEILGQLTEWCQRVGLEWLGLVPGNHDRRTQERPGLPVYLEGFTLEGWNVVHGDGPTSPLPCIQGHEHPCLRLSERVQAACFLVGPDRIILPAYSCEAAGVNVVGRIPWRGYACYAIVGRDVLNFGDAYTLAERIKRRDPARATSHRATESSRSSESQ